MTPAARLSAAIEILDRHLAGQPVERALTNWSRASRFAGSGDRAAVRDLVFDALRRRRSAAARGGGLTGRGLVLGLCRETGQEALFDGTGHAPPPPGGEEQGRDPDAVEVLDAPDWLLPDLQNSLGQDFPKVMEAMRHRAPVFVRANTARIDRPGAIAALAREGIAGQPHPLAEAAIEVTENARKLQASAAFRDGLVELQDAASQAVIEALPLDDGMRVLDHCAGGGGKTLAMAARARLRLFAHDISPQRMADLPQRARRAGVTVRLCERPESEAPFDLVLVDAPCSGSGSWRRDPEGKWALAPERLATLLSVQAEILARTHAMVRPGGWLAYATCSLLRAENSDQKDRFLAAHPDWRLDHERILTPLSGGDGFYIALMQRNPA